MWYFKSTLLLGMVFYMLKTTLWYVKSPSSWQVVNSATDPYSMICKITSLYLNYPFILLRSLPALLIDLMFFWRTCWPAAKMTCRFLLWLLQQLLVLTQLLCATANQTIVSCEFLVECLGRVACGFSAVGDDDAVASQQLSIILLPPRWVQVTTTTTTTTGTSLCCKRGQTPLGVGDDNPMTAWHRLSGSWHHPMPTPTAGGKRHQMAWWMREGGAGGNAPDRIHRQQSTKNWQQ